MNKNQLYDYTPQNNYDVTINATKSTLTNFQQLTDLIPQKQIFLGFDGYIDSLYSMISKRTDSTNWVKMDSMSEFANRIQDASGSSCNIERVLKKKIAGGFAPNMARAISGFGAKVILVGAMGFPAINPLFKEFPENVKLYSIKDMGETAAFEFDDGKVMVTDFGNINQITWDTIMSVIPRDDFIGLIEQSDAIGQGHWSLVPNMNSIWEKMIEEIFPNVTNMRDKIFMVDPSDCKKRTHADINEKLKLLQKIDAFSHVMLSLNDKEAIDITNVIISKDSAFQKKRVSQVKNHEDYIDIGEKLNEVLDISYLVIHDPHFATISTKKSHHWVTEGYTSKPKFTTAAGDFFNGGVLSSLVCGLKPEESLVVGNALTAIFVRTGVYARLNEVRRFIESYFKYIQNDLDELTI